MSTVGRETICGVEEEKREEEEELEEIKCNATVRDPVGAVRATAGESHQSRKDLSVLCSLAMIIMIIILPRLVSYWGHN